MKLNRLLGSFLFLLTVVTQLRAQPTQQDRKLLAETRAEANGGNVESQVTLGDAYFTGTMGLKVNPVEAVKWYRKAAEQNDSDAQYQLAFCYHQGKGVKKNDQEAARWCRKAAEQNMPDAQYGLGRCYANGEGVAKDAAEAVIWYRKAADRNNVSAQFALGGCYLNGQGIAKDYVMSYEWYSLAAAQGDENSVKAVKDLEGMMSPQQIAQGRELARNFRPE